MNRQADASTGDSSRPPDLTRRALVASGAIIVTIAGLLASGLSSTQAQQRKTDMRIYRRGASPTNTAPESTFTGDVQIGDYYRREAPSRLAGATVTFAPGSRTPWKVNPLGQTLIVTSGVGWAQSAGEQVVEVRAGDVIWCPPGQRHWEGATPDQEMTYVAVQEEPAGQGVEFGAKVTDEEYRKGPPNA